MTKPEQIAEILSVNSTDVIVTNGKEARLKDRELTEAEQTQIEHVFYSDEKKELKAVENALKEEAKRLKAEVKATKHRISEATDFTDLKTKIDKVENSEESPTPWADKLELLEGEYTEHKNIVYISLADHTADKDAEPADTPDLYEVV